MNQLNAIANLVREVLGDDAIGAYLHGSTATGRLQPRSDLDVLVLTRRPTSPAEKRTLIDRLPRMSGRGDPTGKARSIELTIVVGSTIKPWRYPPSVDFQYGDWLRSEFEGGDPAPWTNPNPDLAPLITMVLDMDKPLFGPPAAEVFEPVPRADLDRAMVAGIPGLLEDLTGDEANVILTFARVWTTLATGDIRSKDEAADWCLARLPREHRAVLERARAVYLGHHDDVWIDLGARIYPHIEHVLTEIKRSGGVRPA